MRDALAQRDTLLRETAEVLKVAHGQLKRAADILRELDGIFMDPNQYPTPNDVYCAVAGVLSDKAIPLLDELGTSNIDYDK